MPFRPGASLLLSLLFLAAFCGGSAFLDRSSASARTSAANNKITQGQLRILDSQGKPGGLCPLKHTDVKAEVSGFVARVTLTQEFHNPMGENLDDFDRLIVAPFLLTPPCRKRKISAISLKSNPRKL